LANFDKAVCASRWDADLVDLLPPFDFLVVVFLVLGDRPEEILAFLPVAVFFFCFFFLAATCALKSLIFVCEYNVK